MEQDSPPGWGHDRLTEFMELAYENRFATFAKKKNWFGLLIQIDACFVKIANDWVNPTNVLSTSLFYRCHASFRATCEHSVAGQVAETFPQLRSCLEYAGYALHIHQNTGLQETWLRRHENDDTMKAAKREFAISEIRSTIQTANVHAAKRFDELYQRAIDFGAHPNERAVTSNLEIIDSGDRKEFKHAYLHDDGLPLRHVLKSTAQAGVCALEILQEAFAARFELLGVRAELLELRRGI